ncbi:mitochondrial import receptor subunit TOM9-2-like [Quillaja saponaria]|uniref:Mitochondrial import receptor subunit TOM9-2-like n=1 Tax=Quillaja saponaria TaxID=32244 RepID=A0AAD7VE77_QUISA|nr:mitochondrial import receptor subunit TOM9-2-like [Quillaja saponaria]
MHQVTRRTHLPNRMCRSPRANLQVSSGDQGLPTNHLQHLQAWADQVAGTLAKETEDCCWSVSAKDSSSIWQPNFQFPPEQGSISFSASLPTLCLLPAQLTIPRNNFQPIPGAKDPARPYNMQLGPMTNLIYLKLSLTLPIAHKLSYLRSHSKNEQSSLISRLSQSQLVSKGKQAASDAAFVSKKLLKSTGKVAWIAGTTFLVLVVPLIIEMDREQQMNELELQQAILLGTPAIAPLPPKMNRTVRLSK